MTLALATCSYAEHRPEYGAAVRTTVGAPRWRLPYALAGRLPEVTPERAWLGLDEADYRPLYLEKLERAGLDGILRAAQAIADAAGTDRLVLLCFDRLNRPDTWCHRQHLREWLAGHGLDDVPELGATS